MDSLLHISTVVECTDIIHDNCMSITLEKQWIVHIGFLNYKMFYWKENILKSHYRELP